MKLQQLEMLHALAETGTLQAAAERLHRSQAAVSMGLKTLEQDVGFSLFDRTGYRLTLTERGQQFLRQARELLVQKNRLASLTQQLREGAEPSLRVAYDHTCSPRDLFAAIAQVQKTYPATELIMTGESQLRSLRRISAAEADIALCPWMPLFHQHGDFETKFIRDFELILAMAPTLVERFGRIPQRRAELLDLPMLMPQDQELGINLDALIKVPGQQRIRVNDSITQRELLLAGMGWGIIPVELVRGALHSGQLVKVDIPGFLNNVSLEVHLVRASDRLTGPAAQLIWDAF